MPAPIRVAGVEERAVVGAVPGVRAGRPPGVAGRAVPPAGGTGVVRPGSPSRGRCGAGGSPGRRGTG
ncbi:hypothetical protein ABT341_14790, partial [Pseudonocardia alni]